LTSIVYFFPTMEVNETRNCLVTDIILNIKKSAEYIKKTVKPNYLTLGEL